jgi:hypothetical protein
MCFFSNRAVPRRPKQSLSSYCPLDTATFPPDYIAVKKYPLVIQTHGFDSQGFVIDGDPFSGMVEFSLTSGRNAGNNDDHSGMQRFLSVKSKKIGTVVGYKRVVLCADGGHELPIFRTTKLEIIDVICQMTHRAPLRPRRCAGIHRSRASCHPARARRCRVARIGFRFAQGREAGRPRRGKAWNVKRSEVDLLPIQSWKPSRISSGVAPWQSVRRECASHDTRAYHA